MKISAKTVSLGNKKIKLVPLGEIADVRQGLFTGDNKFYLSKESDELGNYRIVDKNKVISLKGNELFSKWFKV